MCTFSISMSILLYFQIKYFLQYIYIPGGRPAEQCSAIFPVISLGSPFPGFNTSIYTAAVFLFTKVCISIDKEALFLFLQRFVIPFLAFLLLFIQQPFSYLHRFVFLIRHQLCLPLISFQQPQFFLQWLLFLFAQLCVSSFAPNFLREYTVVADKCREHKIFYGSSQSKGASAKALYTSYKEYVTNLDQRAQNLTTSTSNALAPFR